MKFTFALIALFTSYAANAAVDTFKNCKSDIVTEVFQNCNDGESGSSTPCGSKITKWGAVSADMTIDSANEKATASVVYTSVSGKVSSSATVCAMDTDHWMTCTTKKPVSELGRLDISFNINGIAPGVYFADIFSENGNVPVGGFQNTDDDCEK